MSTAKDIKTMKQEINGVEYEFQRLPVRPGMEMRQRWNINGEVNDVIMCDELFEHVVVNPKVTLDDFDTESEASEVANVALNFQFPSKGK